MTKLTVAKSLAVAATLLAATAPSRDASAGAAEIASGIGTAYSVYEKFLGNQLTLDQATAQVLTALSATRAELVRTIEGIAAADAKACARAAVIDFQTIDRMSDVDKSLLASNSLQCLTTIEAYIETLQTKPNLDKLGFALNALGPIVLMSRAAAGIPVVPEIPDIIVNSNTFLIQELTPACNVKRVGFPDEDQPQQLNIRCAAYNGDSHSVLTWQGDPERLAKHTNAQNQAARNTSRRVAQAANAKIPTP
jgi:hypothetical protein